MRPALVEMRFDRHALLAQGPHELYDLERDPAELDNRVAAEPELAAGLQAEVEAGTRPAPSAEALIALLPTLAQ